MTTEDKDKPKKKADLGTIAFAKVNKLEKRVLELEKIVSQNRLPSGMEKKEVKTLISV